MQRAHLLEALARHLGVDLEESGAGPIAVEAPAAAWVLAPCPEQASAADYLLAFERGMQTLIDAAANGEGRRLGLALAFGSTERGEPASYRRSLKKYSNSIVFADLGIHLLLARGNGGLLVLPPAEVNAFLRELNHGIARNRA